MNSIFERTWGGRAGTRPETDYWPQIIPAVKERHPGFQCIAEAYRDMEWELQQQGFDYGYDKRLCDRMEHDPAESVRLHFCADLPYQEKLVRFIENHDEPRAATAFTPEKHRTAVLTIMTLPGACLIHEGQMEGRRVRLPVFLARRPDEPPDEAMLAFYRQLLETLRGADFLDGTWSLCERTGWPDNASYLNLVSWCWVKDEERYLIVVNFSDGTSQALVRVPWDALRGRTWRLNDVLSGEIYDRSGNEIRDAGLYVDLKPWECHLFHVYAL